MQCLQKTRILDFHPDTLEVVRRSYGFDKPEDMSQAVDILEDWVKQQSHFTKKDFNREYLERAIIGTKGSIERTKEKLDKMCTYKTLWPNYFTEFGLEAIKEYGDDAQFIPLPKLTENNHRVFLARCCLQTFKPTFVLDIFKLVMMYMEYAKAHDYTNGYILVLDYSDLNISELLPVLNITELRIFVSIILKGYEARVAGIHVWSKSKLIDILLKIVKQVLSAKLNHRLHLHSKFESIYDFVPKTLLPIEYGGEERSIRIIYGTLMGLSREQSLKLPHLQDIIDDSPRMYDIVFKRMTKWYLQIDPVFWLTHLHRAQKSFLVKLSEFGKAIIAHRIDHLKTLEDQKKTDLMSAQEDQSTNTQLSVVDRFILSRDLNEPDMLDEIFTIFTSSQEASAKIASFTLLMMAYHPQCQDKFYAELKSVMGEEHRPVTDEDLKKMPYLDMVFREVVRLFPIGALLQRTIPEDIVISSGTLPAGCSLVIPIYHLHRDPRFWSKPEDFDPERFSPENTKKRHPYCYIPFSLGPMDCLGRYFGTKLVKTICARVLLQYRVTSLETYKDLKLAIAVSVMSLEGYKMILTPRSAN